LRTEGGTQMSAEVGFSRLVLALPLVAVVLATAASAPAATSAAKPTISSFSPKSAKPLALLTVMGKNFIKVKTVKVDGIVAKLKVVSTSKLTATVPSSAKTGKIVVTTATGSATSATALTILSSTTSAASGNAAAGMALFQQNCETCHGATGMGGNGGPDLQDEPLAKTEAGVIKQVTNGGGGMPAFAGQFSSAQIKDLAAFVTEKIN
jgi:cytochrome c551